MWAQADRNGRSARSGTDRCPFHCRRIVDRGGDGSAQVVTRAGGQRQRHGFIPFQKSVIHGGDGNVHEGLAGRDGRRAGKRGRVVDAIGGLAGSLGDRVIHGESAGGISRASNAERSGIVPGFRGTGIGRDDRHRGIHRAGGTLGEGQQGGADGDRERARSSRAGGDVRKVDFIEWIGIAGLGMAMPCGISPVRVIGRRCSSP